MVGLLLKVCLTGLGLLFHRADMLWASPPSGLHQAVRLRSDTTSDP